MTAQQGKERRLFDRIAIDVPARLILDSGELESEIIDFSLKGALIKRQKAWHPIEGSDVVLECDLAGGQQEMIRMEAQVSHISKDAIGLKCIHIDLDSIMRLRRLVELNLSDPSLLERNLEHLIMPTDD